VSHEYGHFTPDRWPNSQIYDFLVEVMKKQEEQSNAANTERLAERPSTEAAAASLSFGERLQAALDRFSRTTRLVPFGLSRAAETLLETPLWKAIELGSDITRSQVHEFFCTEIAAAIRGKEAISDELLNDLLQIVWCSRSRYGDRELSLLFYWMWLELLALVGFERLADALREIPIHGHWRDLSSMHMLAFSDLTDHTSAASSSPSPTTKGGLEQLLDAIEKLFASQLQADAAILEQANQHGGGDAAMRRQISKCALGAPRMSGGVDKRSRLAKRIAVVMYPLREPTAEQRAAALAANKDPLSFTKAKSYLSYQAVLRHLRNTLRELDPVLSEQQLQSNAAVTQARLLFNPNARTLELLDRIGPSLLVTNPRPEVVEVCPLEELQPLLEYLAAKNAVTEQMPFPRGTLVPDGRLDLCKQVVGPRGIQPLLDAMADNQHVDRLLLGNNIVGDGGAEAIGRFIRSGHSRLTTWYIAGNDFTADGIRHVTEALEHDTQVKGLWLKRNPLLPAGIVPIARLLEHNTYLQTLDLVNTGMLDQGVETLVAALRRCGRASGLRHLYLSSNAITADGARHVADYLASGDSQLETLYLSVNRLGDQGAAVLASGLEHDRTLRRLSLASNRMGAAGATAIANALVTHPTLQWLDMGFTRATAAVGELGNFIGDDGARAFADMLRRNTTLRSLDFLHNQIGQVGVNHLRAAMRLNHTLTSLQLTQFGKVHNEVAREEIKSALARNRAAAIAADHAALLAEIAIPEHLREIYSVYRTKGKKGLIDFAELYGDRLNLIDDLPPA